MLTIRVATAVDQGAVTAFARRTFDDTFAGQNTPEDMRSYLDRAFNDAQQSAELADPQRVTLLANENDTLVGYAQLHWSKAPACVGDSSSVELVRLYVDRSVQGRGVAQKLLLAAEEAAQPRSRVMWLGVWEHNPRAIAFYTKCGFHPVGSQVFKLGNDAQTDHIMVKAL